MKVFFLISLLTCLSVQSQKYILKYEVNVNDSSLKWGTYDSYQLVTKTDGINSIEYRKDKDTVIIHSSGVLFETKSKYFTDSLKFKRFKNLENRTIEYTTYNRQNYIKDTINIDYKIGNKKKTILNLECYNLFFEFRGRYYEAYYAKDIPIAGGPFKFIGAPGAILEVNSFDESIKIKATAISHDLNSSEKLFIDKKKWFGKTKYTFSYNNYVEFFLNKWYEIITKNESEYPGSQSSFNSRRIEILPNKLDPEIHD